MIRPILHASLMLNLKTRPATKEDLPLAKDLLETLPAHKKGYVGMGANIIGKAVAIIPFLDDNGSHTLMLNPEIVKESDRYVTEEGCLSLLGGPRTAVRYRSIKVRYETEDFKVRLKTHHGFPAQIIRHKIDHTKGILIERKLS